MKRTVIATLTVVGLLMAACGGDDDGATSASEPGPGASATAATEQPGSATSQDTGPSGSAGAEQDEPHNPDGVVRFAYDLVAAQRGGFSFDPREATQPVLDDAVYHWVYGALMRKDANGELVPELAESAEVLDPKTIEIVLRPDLTLSDGSPLTSRDVKASLDRNLAEEYPAFLATFYSLESVEVVDDTTVLLHIPDGTAESWFPLFMSRPETVPIPEGTNFADPVGAGPLMVAETEAQQRMVFERNPEYWNPDSVRVAGVELIHAADPQSGVSAVRAGQADWALTEYTYLDAAGSSLESLVVPSAGRLVNMPICKTTEPFDDVQVRQAVNHAIDREAINEGLLGGTGLPAWGIWPEGHPFYTDTVEEPSRYDPDEARRLLAEAGYPDGFEFDVMAFPQLSTTVAQVVQQQLADVGITMNLVPTANFVEEFWIRHEAAVGVIPVKSENPRLNHWVGDEVANVCDYNDPQLNEWSEQLRVVSPDSDEAIELWHTIQEYLAENVLSFFVVYGSDVSVYDPERIGGVAYGDYVIVMPDLWQIYVKP